MEKKKRETGALRSQLMRRLLTGSPCFEISPHCSFVPQGGCTTSMAECAFAYRGDRGRMRKKKGGGGEAETLQCVQGLKKGVKKRRRGNGGTAK